MSALIVPILEAVLRFAYYVIKDIARGNPVKKRKKAGDKVGNEIEDGLERR
jgi:hypothetical protein